METKAANASSQYNTVDGKKPTAARNPAVVLALDRVNADATVYSTGQVPSVPNGARHAMSSTGAGKPSHYGGAPGWDTVRRIFNPHRGECYLSLKFLIKLEICQVVKKCLLNVFFRLRPLLPYAQYERPVQFTALCTSSGVRLLTCPAEEEK